MKQDWETTLFDIQGIDLEIASMEGRLSGHPAQLGEIKARFAQLKEEKEAAARNVQDTQVAIRRTEGEINDLKNRKKEFQTKSSLIRNNEEYKAALTQMALCDKSVSDLESSQIELMDKLEEANKALDAVNDVIARAREAANARLDEIELERKECQQGIATLKERRAALVGDVPAPIMARYDRLVNAPNNDRRRPVFVSIEGGICGRCKMKLTPQTISDVRKGKTSFCTYCGAILYEG